MRKLGRDLDSKQHWEEVGSEYVEALEQEYHRQRLEVIRALIPQELFEPASRVFDFGCGDGVHLLEFLNRGVVAEGVDIAETMIAHAQKRLANQGYDAKLARVGGVETLRGVPDASLNAILSFNVLAYLTDHEEQTFYEEAARIVRPGGYLVVTHSNELFDIFSLNRYTLDFFKRHLVADPLYHPGLASLLTQPHLPEIPTAYNVRENPLTYRYKLLRHGFEEVSQEFSNFHLAPPPILQNAIPEPQRNASEAVMFDRKTYPATLEVSEEDRWKLMFVCSTYGSCSRRCKR